MFSTEPRIPPLGQPPEEGELVRDFAITLARGGPTQLSHICGSRNLILVLGGDEPSAKMLRMLSDSSAALREEDTVVLAIVPGISRESAEIPRRGGGLAFALIADEDLHLHEKLGALDAAGRPAAAVLIADRYLRIAMARRAQRGQMLPTREEVLQCLRAINLQCPECGVAEWPA